MPYKDEIADLVKEVFEDHGSSVTAWGIIGLEDALELQQKGKAYGDSWKRRGGVGAFFVMARKWDRLENLLIRVGYDIFRSDELALDETIRDTMADLRRYLTLIENHLRLKKPL